MATATIGQYVETEGRRAYRERHLRMLAERRRGRLPYRYAPSPPPPEGEVEPATGLRVFVLTPDQIRPADD